jgi:hypothetical protein
LHCLQSFFFVSFLSSEIGIHRPKSKQDPKHKCLFLKSGDALRKGLFSLA